MSDGSQIRIPPSFHAVHADARGRLRLSPSELAERYELCEDLAQAMVDRTRTLQADLGLDEVTVLQRVAAGLAEPAAGIGAAEAAWIGRRLAELLGWPAAR